MIHKQMIRGNKNAFPQCKLEHFVAKITPCFLVIILFFTDKNADFSTMVLMYICVNVQNVSEKKIIIFPLGIHII